MRWYLSYPLSYRQVEELIKERGLPVDHSTVFRLLTTLGEWMRPISKLKSSGNISIVLWIQP
ncbi:hypothetical protein AVDCRST_MAG94-178, partial [uncultured Leptolyngbya sp.]